ncbi:MAG: glucuronyl hydrolase [Sphingobacteriales bacterium]|nr:glucuronyl hydrolase [Sphingobacteriales bacterium]
MKLKKNMNKLLLITPILFLCCTFSFAQKKTSKIQNMSALVDQQFKFASAQYKVLSKNVPEGVMPVTYNAQKDKVETSDTKWWCSGFYPGTLLYIYEYTKDPAIMIEAKSRLAILKKEKHHTGNHDLGFMMFCSFGNAYRLTGDADHKATVDTAAQSLSTRYRPIIKSIQSWDSSKNFTCPVIIDNMMNLELLCWVSANGGDKKFYEIAINHANSTLKNHFRKDYSSYHVLDYDLNTGDLLRKVNWQGASDSSAWSRGQSWGLYGFTMMYRFTKDKQYLDQAQHIAKYLIKHPNMPSDMVPYWDFNAPGIPNTYRDASAAAIMASALLELGQYSDKTLQKQYVNTAEKMIRSLASPKYRARLGENGGFLLMHNTGALPQKSEVDVPLTYADYYFLEALLRYKKWYL